MQNKFSILFITALLLFPLLSTKVQASVRCETQYGGGQVCVKTGNLQVNKQIHNTFDSNCGSDWSDNMGERCSKRFSTGEEVEFRIQVKNVGDAKFDKVTITDTLPRELSLSSGNLNTEVSNLEVGQTQEVFIKAKIVSDISSGINCNIINTAEVRSGNEYDKDTTRICSEKGGVTAKALPKAGSEDNFTILGLSALLISTGIFLLKSKARIYA